MLEKYNAYKLGWLRDFLWLITAVAVIIVLFRFIIGISVVDGNSMEPSLHRGNVVVYLRPVREYEPGDIVCLRIPSGDYYIKRVAAAGEATVEIYDGKVYVNDTEQTDPHADGATEREAGAVVYPYEVDRGDYFVLGDNRGDSVDSRYFGRVSRRQIKGRIILAVTGNGIRRPEDL